AATGRGLPVHTLLLAGVIVGIFFSAAITVLISLVDTNRLGGVIHWLLGNLAPIPAGAHGVFAAVTALGLWLVLGKARALNLLALGEEGAQELGVDAERIKRRIFEGSALLTGAVVAFVRLDGVDFAYPKAAPGRSRFEIRDLSFAVAPGEVLGLIGPNAAGKTTVIHLLSKVLTPSRGEIFVEGEPLRSLGRAEVARR